MFRQFGRIRDIIPANPASKELPRYAIITFLYVRSATAAKNCLHQTIETGTKIHISYESVHKATWFIWDWLVNHPRITIPAAAALFALIMGTIFDPIRSWSVENKVSRKWHVENSRAVQWLRRSWDEFVPFGKRKAGQEQVWQIDENVKKVKDWIGENQESFIVVVGPKGTAKREMIMEGVLEGRPKYHSQKMMADIVLL
jgi:RNA12 protein/RNA recognition motif. (a.k.a. RRM, RBD, or RNP domain)